MNKKQIRAMLLCVLMLCSTLLMCACKNENDPDNSANAVYKVTVVDSVGNPYTEKIIVKFMQGETQIAMVPINAQGVAEKELAKGDYSVEIASTDSKVKYYFDAAAAKLTAEQTEIKVALANEMGEAFETINAESVTMEGSLSYDAYYVEMGSTHVPVTAEDRNYFLFAPTQAGTYEFSVTNDAASIGVYGGSVHYIVKDSVHEVVDNKITISVASSMISTGNTGTTVYVIGLDATEGVKDCVLNIIRTGDPAWSFTEEPWSTYQPSEEITDYTLPEGIKLKEFDLTAATGTYNLVLNEDDGCYHINAADGPMVFVQLSEGMYGISMKDMVGEIVYQDGVLMQTGSAPFRYSYNNGQDDFFKEDYTNAMRQYVTCRDKQSGVYPLNKDLFYILPKGIEAMGWCREDTMNYLFRDVSNVNAEYIWMFLLVHEDAAIPEYVPVEDPTEPSTDPTVDVTSPTEPATEPTTVSCNHSYNAATCTAPKTCKNCGQTTGSAMGHNYSNGKCIRCGEEKNSTKPTTPSCNHSYSAATCTKPQTCKNCGQTSGSALGHSYSSGKCKRCGAADPNATSKPIEDNKNSPIEIGGTLEFDAEVKANHVVYYSLYRVNDTNLTIKSKDAYVIYNGKTYTAKDGVVTVPGLRSDSMVVPTKIAIGNSGTSDATFHVTLSYDKGHLMNPYSLTEGSVTTKIAAGNEQGVYYKFTAPESGTLTIKLASVTSGVDCNITITNESQDSKQVSLANDSSDGKTVSLKVKAGDVIQVIIGTLPDSSGDYPAATITTVVTY